MTAFSGITKLRFKPAFNPYTEPSMEVFSYHEGNIFNIITANWYQIVHEEENC